MDVEDPNPIFLGFFFLVFIAAWITAVVSWFRMVTAKDRKTYWKSIALFVGPILLVFAIAEIGGLFPEVDFQSQPLPEPPMAGDVLAKMPFSQKVLLAAAAVSWIGGLSVLFVLHNKRTNKRWWHQLNPLNPPFKDFNGKEWTILLGLVAVTMVLGMAGISQRL